MTDYDKLVDMFNRAKIAYDTNISIIHRNGEEILPQKGKSLTVEGGYLGFISVFVFDEGENLIKVGAYE